MTQPTFTKLKAPIVSTLDRLIDWLILIGLITLTCLVCCSCGSSKTIPVETIKEVTKTDTLYLNTFRFDSTYVSHDLLTDRSRDTILIKETNTEIRNKLLRDTVERVKIKIQRDSIPYKVTVTQVKEAPRPLSAFDHICRYSFFFLLVIILYLAYRKIRLIK